MFLCDRGDPFLITSTLLIPSNLAHTALTLRAGDLNGAI